MYKFNLIQLNHLGKFYLIRYLNYKTILFINFYQKRVLVFPLNKYDKIPNIISVGTLIIKFGLPLYFTSLIDFLNYCDNTFPKIKYKIEKEFLQIL